MLDMLWELITLPFEMLECMGGCLIIAAIGLCCFGIVLLTML
jgi:hypothetical protein